MVSRNAFKWLTMLGLMVMVMSAGMSEARAKERIFTSFYPLEFVAKSLVGDQVEVWNPVKSDPADWKPNQDDIRAIQGSRLIFINGAGFEKWPRIVSLPRSKVIETTARFRKEWLTYEGGKAHRHGDKVHTHVGFDGHTWLSPKRFLVQIQDVYLAIKRANLIEEGVLLKRYQELTAAFTQLDSKWQETGKRLAESGYVYTNHPAYNYLAKDYGFKVKNFDISPGEGLSKKDKEDLRRARQNHPGKQFWWESAPDSEQSQFIEQELKLEVRVVSPGEVRGDTTFLEVMKAHVATL